MHIEVLHTCAHTYFYKKEKNDILDGGIMEMSSC